MAPNLESYLPECERPDIRRTSRADLGKLPADKCRQLRFISQTHVESFDWFLEKGLPSIADAVDPIEFQFDKAEKKSRFRLEIETIEIGTPNVPEKSSSKYRKVFPTECRQRKMDYTAPVHVTFNLTNIDSGEGYVLHKEELLQMPLMVLSSKCHLRGLTPDQLVAAHEDHFEIGGYFITGGNEKVIRLLNMNRRNFPIGLHRKGWTKRRTGYCDSGIMLRCIDRFERTSNVNLHINKFDEMEVVFYVRKQMFHLPLMTIVRAMCAWTDFEIYREFAQTMEEEPNYCSAIKRMLNEETNAFKHTTQKEALEFIGSRFRVLNLTPEWKSHVTVAKAFLRKYCMIHLDDDIDKVRLFGFMARKVFKLEHKKCMAENIDSPENHEVLLPGHLFQAMSLEYFEDYLKLLVQIMMKEYQKQLESGSDVVGSNMLNFAVNKAGTLGQNFRYLIATGNMRSSSGLGLQQVAGLVVGAEKINWARFYSHFRSIHRGAFFQEMRTTSPRKLATAAWGFICPVHTPDGPPCGLLNHLAHTVKIHVDRLDTKQLVDRIHQLGVKSGGIRADIEDIPVLLDGKLVGWIGNGFKAETLVLYLRRLKLEGKGDVPPTLEIVHCPRALSDNEAVMSPGIYLLTEPARMMRPVLNLTHNKVEMVGVMEQVWLHICVTAAESHELTNYQELYPMAIMSELACMSPFSNMNAGARVILQCQMAKQTFGWPSYTLNYRSDNKMYRLLTPQEPVVRSKLHDAWNMDDYPLGTNLMIAVVSYTGYDLEDSICVNKMARERGLMYGTIYKTKMVDLEEEARSLGYRGGLTLGCRDKFDPNEVRNYYKVAGRKLDLDGLPFVGTIVTHKDVTYCYWDRNEERYCVGRYDGHAEDAIVDSVRIFESKQPSVNGELVQAAIQFRIGRPVNIGDKMASRHGQKGICSRLWAAADLPWTETGMMPDLIFNPHGFPSRMTVGMMIEFLGGKAGMVNGRVYDSTPFVFDEDYPAEKHFGEILREAGLNYHGMERMYSGTSGEELEADIFFGCVYYQRLRHMVYDKFQARAGQGPCDPYTRQPVKGRARGGGVRMGEMERDGLISHGCAFIARDRLLHCSDYVQARICSKCGSVLTPTNVPTEQTKDFKTSNQVDHYQCSACGPDAKLVVTDMPYVIKYLSAELACMNVKMNFKFKETDMKNDCVIEEL